MEIRFIVLVFLGRFFFVMVFSQIIYNFDLREGYMLKGWFEYDGYNMDFYGYKNDGMGGGGGGEGFSFDFDFVY